VDAAPRRRDTTITRFGLAPMSADMRILSRIALAVPLPLIVAVAVTRGPLRDALFAATALVVLLYAAVWLFWRPTRFEVDRAGLRILWPLRVRSIPTHEIVEAVPLSRETFRREFGWGLRVGAGGLWGGFGWVYTRKGWVGLYVSRTDRFVLLRLRTGHPLLVTPDGDERFVAALRSVSRGMLPPAPAPAASPG
jgi:PH (Pleckstrin Homology) domain-containing protein